MSTSGCCLSQLLFSGMDFSDLASHLNKLMLCQYALESSWTLGPQYTTTPCFDANLRWLSHGARWPTQGANLLLKKYMTREWNSNYYKNRSRETTVSNLQIASCLRSFWFPTWRRSHWKLQLYHARLVAETCQTPRSLTLDKPSFATLLHLLDLHPLLKLHTHTTTTLSASELSPGISAAATCMDPLCLRCSDDWPNDNFCLGCRIMSQSWTAFSSAGRNFQKRKQTEPVELKQWHFDLTHPWTAPKCK